MKRTIILIVIFAVLSGVNCKKDNTQSFQSYLKFKLDNVQTECNAHITATYLPSTISPDVIITISGNWTDGAIALKLNEGQVLTPGTYIFQNGTSRSGELWTTGPLARYYAAVGGGVFNPSINDSGQITITEISADYIKGSFDFVTHVDGSTNTFKTITSGEFHIKRG
jgi:hypothetical protein